MEGVDKQEERFERLWNDRDPNVDVYTVPESVEEDIADLRDRENRAYDPPGGAASDPEPGITLRDYQREAVDAWFDNGCRGLFRMATGTGKTFTALASLDEYSDTVDDSLLCVITVTQKHLAQQWATK